MMSQFTYKNDELFCENVSVKNVAQKIGTPFYLYSRKAIENNFELFSSTFSSFPHLICYSVKSNSNLAILKTLLNKGAGFDIVSGGELFRVLKIGTPPERIVFSGVGKTAEELKMALDAGILLFNVESRGEMILLNRLAQNMSKKASIALRVNPNVDPKTHPYITTGLKENKFGIDMKEAMEIYQKPADFPSLEFVGIDCHLGSQITDLEPYIIALKKLLQMIDDLSKVGINLKYLDLGGGLGISYKSDPVPSPQNLGEQVLREFQGRKNLTFIFEPGRSIVGPAGILVSKVLYLKEKEEKNFLIVDAAMNDLARPSLYNSYHEIKPVELINSTQFVVDVVGPVCESSDFLAKNRTLTKMNPDDLIAIMDAGAYGFSMASNYNSRPKIPEVLVSGDDFWIVRQRETYEDLIKGEVVPDF